MAIPFLHSRVQRFDLVLAGVPENFKILLRTVPFRVKLRVHPVYDLLIRATLERNHLALVVETEVEV